MQDMHICIYILEYICLHLLMVKECDERHIDVSCESGFVRGMCDERLGRNETAREIIQPGIGLG